MWTDDQRSNEELFAASLDGDYEDEPAWDAVRALRLRNIEEVFRLAVDYIQSAEPLKLARGWDVLAQLGAGRPISERPHFDERLAIAIGLVQDSDPLVVHSAAWALAHLGGDLAISALIRMRNDSDPDVRLAVANGMQGSGREDALATLIELMNDVSDNVRDWATFELGTQCEVASDEIQDALRKRLADSYEKARNEAIWGLAQRKDVQGLKMLVDRLSAEEWIAGDEMAAAKTLDVPMDTPVEQLCDGLRKLLR